MNSIAIDDIEAVSELEREEQRAVRGGLGPVPFAIGMFAVRVVLANTSHNGSDDDHPIITDEVRNAGMPKA